MTEDQAQPNNQDQISLDQLQADLDNAMNGWKRTQADFENYKRQKEKENKELVEFAREVTVAKLLPTLDVLGQALKHLPEYYEAKGSLLQNAEDAKDSPLQGYEFGKQYKNWQIGINGILMQLDGVLAELGVKKIECVGKKFDPHLHEAVREQESENDDGIILEELQTGFELNGKVIRPSQVVISKRK